MSLGLLGSGRPEIESRDASAPKLDDLLTNCGAVLLRRFLDAAMVRSLIAVSLRWDAIQLVWYVVTRSTKRSPDSAEGSRTICPSAAATWAATAPLAHTHRRIGSLPANASRNQPVTEAEQWLAPILNYEPEPRVAAE